MDTVSTIDKDSLTSCDANVIKLFLHGDESSDLVANTLMLNAPVDFFFKVKGLTVHLCRIKCCVLRC